MEWSSSENIYCNYQLSDSYSCLWHGACGSRQAPLFFFHHINLDSRIFTKVTQNPNKVARDIQGLPTVPHKDVGGLNFKCLAFKHLLLMTLPPSDDDKIKIKKNRTSLLHHNFEKGKRPRILHHPRRKFTVQRRSYKFRKRFFIKSYGPASCDWGSIYIYMCPILPPRG